MKLLHCIEFEFEETIDDSLIEGKTPKEIAEQLAHNYIDKVEAFSAAIEADGLKKTKEIYGLRKPACLCEILRGIADSIEKGECQCCEEEDEEENTEEEKCE